MGPIGVGSSTDGSVILNFFSIPDADDDDGTIVVAKTNLCSKDYVRSRSRCCSAGERHIFKSNVSMLLLALLNGSRY